MPPHPASVQAIVHLDRLRRNIAAARSLLPPSTRIYGVVKANAYGHGVLAVAKAMERDHVQGLTVDSVGEGMALRDGGIRAPILMLAPLLPDLAPAVARYRLTATVASAAAAAALDAAATAGDGRLPVHVRISAGPAGLGVAGAEAGAFLTFLRGLPNLRVEGLYVHMTGPYRNDHQQIDRETGQFADLVATIAAAGLRPPLVHAATSPGLLNARAASFDMVRLGSVLYGIRMNPPDGSPFPFEPIMEVRSRVAFITDLAPGSDIGYGPQARLDTASRIAMIPIGYADAPYLHLRRAGWVLIRGRRAPLIGEASMGMMLADVSDIPDLAPGEEVVVVGRQGAETITTEMIGDWCGLKPSAVLMLGPRVVRSYVGGDSDRCRNQEPVAAAPA